MTGRRVAAARRQGAAALLATLATMAGCEAPQMTDRMEEGLPAREAAPVLHVALQDGFEGVRVEVRVNGQEAYRKDRVLTDVRIGYADSFEIPMPARPVVLLVNVPGAGVQDSVRIDLPGSVYAGVSVVEGRLSFRISDQPFGYL